MVTPFYFWFYMCVQIFITIQRIIKSFLGQRSLNHAIMLVISISPTLENSGHLLARKKYSLLFSTLIWSSEIERRSLK